jgi:hypothetical protein
MVKNIELMKRIEKTEIKVDKAFSILNVVKSDVAEMKPVIKIVNEAYKPGGTMEQLNTLVTRHDEKIKNVETDVNHLKNKEWRVTFALICFLISIIGYFIKVYLDYVGGKI